jgi:hypothetical protein
MEASQPANAIVPRPEKQMIRVREDDAGMKLVPEVALAQALYRGLRSDRHENRGRNFAVRGMENTGPGPRDRAFGEDFKCDRVQAKCASCPIECSTRRSGLRASAFDKRSMGSSSGSRLK